MAEERQHVPLYLAAIPFVVMMIAMMVTIIVFEGSPHIPLLIGAVTAGLLAWCRGFSWGEIEESIYTGIRKVLPAVVILMLVGMLISAWVGGGIVGAMIYYGLEFLSPDWFLPALMVICAISTLMMGSSWSTIGTLGIAGMAAGTSMGIAPAAIAGVVVSGAFFGDKMSPLSDTTVLASGIAGANIFEHIRHMLYTTLPGLALALVIYVLMAGDHSASDMSQSIGTVTNALQTNYVISPWLFVVPLMIPLLAISRVPAIPTLVVGIILGSLACLWVQGSDIATLFDILQSGYVAHTGNETVDGLLSQGGLESMMYTVSLAIIAMIFGGIMESTGMLNAIVGGVLKLASSGRRLCAATVVSSFLTNILTAEQYISIILPGRMYARAYQQRELHPKNLSRALEDGGTITSALVPWSTDAVFVYSALGVSAWAYAPYAVLNYSVPIISILMSLAGIAIVGRREQATVSTAG
ncbi:Na+/H+ antiporter NhaC [Kushneria phosphatilytica]|uniref:Na+/H+ antiporter NhaC n=1 Tax=Kushneria phosphatilytica TaxID=657387 RepID=A0A1S1NQZ2_9GAMM|nr:Na+/H+ antiporter NhaC [Kushneria phosphatilytica]OHV08327.1 Na+/H+ antiporter NhaC [Kushneria phosphatilytica]QEL09741.1 Na+/H+ antiporter NhaC [Kushneria phosphatilytica]